MRIADAIGSRKCQSEIRIFILSFSSFAFQISADNFLHICSKLSSPETSLNLSATLDFARLAFQITMEKKSKAPIEPFSENAVGLLPKGNAQSCSIFEGRVSGSWLGNSPFAGNWQARLFGFVLAIADCGFASSLPMSGAEATAVQTLPRPPSISMAREASGLRRVYRRFLIFNF